MSALKTARAAWEPQVPDWIVVLARACDSSSQARVAADLGRSPSLVNQVLKGRYKGDLSAVEARVRGIFMGSERACPALGRIKLNQCQDWREKARRFTNTNGQRVRMFRACNACAVNRKEGHG